MYDHEQHVTTLFTYQHSNATTALYDRLRSSCSYMPHTIQSEANHGYRHTRLEVPRCVQFSRVGMSCVTSVAFALRLSTKIPFYSSYSRLVLAAGSSGRTARRAETRTTNKCNPTASEDSSRRQVQTCAAQGSAVACQVKARIRKGSEGNKSTVTLCSYSF